MAWQNLPYAIILVIAAVSAAVNAVVAWRRRDIPGGVYFVFLMAAVCEWALASAGEYLALTLESKILWAKISYVGIVSVPPLWLLFTVYYRQNFGWFSGWRSVLPWILPPITLTLAATNDLHHLIWPTIIPSSAIAGDMLIYSHGPAFWVHAAYAYLCMISGSFLLMQGAFRSTELFRRQVIALVAAAAFPLLGNILYLAGLSPLPGLDLTPIFFALSGLLVVFGIFRFRILDIMPVARDAVFEKMPDGVLVLDTRGRIRDINPAACVLLKTDPAATVGKPAATALDGWPGIARLCIDQEISQNTIQTNGVTWLDLRVSPLVDSHERVSGRLVVLRDITAAKTAEEKLLHYTRELEERNAELDAFAHTVAHDLKKPLGTLSKSSQAALKYIDGMDREKLLQSQVSINQSSVRIASIIDDLLLLTNLRKTEVVSIQPLNMDQVIDKALAQLSDLVQESQVEIRRPPLWPIAMGYAPWVEQVWVNYISNAIVFGGSPPIVDLGFDEIPAIQSPSHEAQLLFWIRDNGKGLTPLEQERLFVDFNRLEQARVEGHGLGLAVVRRIVEKLGGKVGVESRVSFGSRFYFTLPICKDTF